MVLFSCLSIIFISILNKTSGTSSGAGGGKMSDTDSNPDTCYEPTMVTSGGVWQGQDPMDYSLPILILQVIFIVLMSRMLVFLLKPFNQPKIIIEIFGGIVLGPSVLGTYKKFADHIFPLKSVMLLETVANMGLLYFLFLVGVEMDITVLKHTGKKAVVVAISGMIVPFVIGASCSVLFKERKDENIDVSSFILFLGVVVSVTAFPVLACILAELKLLNTELGKLALSAALVSDMCAWVLLSFAIALAQSETTNWAAVGVVLSSVAFVIFCIFIIRPAMNWIISQKGEEEYFNEAYICLILTGVMVNGCITDAIGTHAVFGAFVYGLVIPNGPLGIALIERIEDLVTELLLPIFFATSGLRTNIYSVDIQAVTWILLLLIIVLCGAAKLGITVLISQLYHMPLREGVSLGLLMNTKGLIEMIIINVGKDQKVVDDQAFAIMVILAVVTTSVVTPAVTILNRPSKRFMPYKRRTVQTLKPDSELRMLTCIHTPRNVPTIINLLEATNHTRRSPICLYALYLVELTGHASAMLIVHNTHKPGLTALNRNEAEADQIFNALQNYEQQAIGVSIQAFTAISAYSTMHEDICNLAEDNRATIIIVPFHKQQSIVGDMEATNPAIRNVNQNLLANAPCSIGILVDRGLGGFVRVKTNHVSHHIVVLFFGGPDDREALAYACRMVEQPGVTLTIIRFLPGDVVVEPTVQPQDPNDQKILTLAIENDKEKQIDDEFINVFRTKKISNNSIKYVEKVVNNGEETVAAMRSIESNHDLFIVGRGNGMTSLTSGLTDWSECPELGAIGDLLASSDFTATVSVLVVQQYIGMGTQDGNGTPDSLGEQTECLNNIPSSNPRGSPERES